MKRLTMLFFFQVVFCFGAISQISGDSTRVADLSEDTKAGYKERKGFAFELGLGYGYTRLIFDEVSYGNYGISGLNFDVGLGFYASPHSRILFKIKSNIFLSDVGEVYKKWIDVMSGDDLVAIGAILISPFVFSYTPWFRSHFMFPSVEYTHFIKNKVPSLFFKGGLGMGVVYERKRGYSSSGLGVSAGAGYEFIKYVGCHAELMYMNDVNKSHMQAVTVLVGLVVIVH